MPSVHRTSRWSSAEWEAGRALDVVVLERVMHARPVPDVHAPSRVTPSSETCAAPRAWLDRGAAIPGWRLPQGDVVRYDRVPAVSVDTCAAWELVLTLAGRGWVVRLRSQSLDRGPSWDSWARHTPSGVVVRAGGPTAALALSRVALLTVDRTPGTGAERRAGVAAVRGALHQPEHSAR